MKVNLCDRCKKEVIPEATRDSMQIRKPRFYRIRAMWSGASDGWFWQKQKLELCWYCTSDFFNFINQEVEE